MKAWLFLFCVSVAAGFMLRLALEDSTYPLQPPNPNESVSLPDFQTPIYYDYEDPDVKCLRYKKARMQDIKARLQLSKIDKYFSGEVTTQARVLNALYAYDYFVYEAWSVYPCDHQARDRAQMEAYWRLHV